MDSVWAAPAGGAVVPAEAKHCAATIFLGKENDTSQANIFGLKQFVPPYAYKFGDSYFVGGSLSRVIGELGQFVAYEIDSGVGQRFGSLREEEVWIALYARWKYFPWNDYLRTSVAASTGVSYASAIPRYEILKSGNNRGQRLLHYFSPEITFGLPSYPDTELVIRSQHRSGGGMFFGTNFPVYGFSWSNRGRTVPDGWYQTTFLIDVCRASSSRDSIKPDFAHRSCARSGLKQRSWRAPP